MPNRVRFRQTISKQLECFGHPVKSATSIALPHVGQSNRYVVQHSINPAHSFGRLALQHSHALARGRRIGLSLAQALLKDPTCRTTCLGLATSLAKRPPCRWSSTTWNILPTFNHIFSLPWAVQQRISGGLQRTIWGCWRVTVTRSDNISSSLSQSDRYWSWPNSLSLS